MADVREEYSLGLYSLAKEEGLTDSILSDVRLLSTVFKENSDYIKLMCAPNVQKEERVALVDSAFKGRVNQYTLNFLKILIEKGYFASVLSCCEEYVDLYNKDNGIEVVTAISCVPLSDSQREKLIAVLSKKLEKKIELIEKTDASLIGGIKLEMQGKLIDASLKARFDSIREALNSTVL